MAKLDYITIKGFKSIAHLERLALEPINVLIGPNGSGKSNFIGVFSFLRAVRSGKLRDFVMSAGGADRLLHFGSRTTSALAIDVSFEQGRNRYEIVLAAGGADDLYPREETTTYTSERTNRCRRKELSPNNGEAGISVSPKRSQTINGYIRRHLDSWRLHHFHDTSPTSPIRKTADVHDNRVLRPDGSNLAAFLFYLQQKHRHSYDLIRRTVQRVAPFFDDFILEPQALNEDKIRLEWRHKGADAYFDASSLSDGTLRFIALASLLLQPVGLRPSVILLDEPELGLHPYAITMLASLVRQASAHTQVILSTQSSLLLDHFDPGDVLVADRKDGGTTLTRLDANRLEHWLRDYSLGQLWEKNELGGRPTREWTGGESAR